MLKTQVSPIQDQTLNCLVCEAGHAVDHSHSSLTLCFPLNSPHRAEYENLGSALTPDQSPSHCLCDPPATLATSCIVSGSGHAGGPFFGLQESPLSGVGEGERTHTSKGSAVYPPPPSFSRGEKSPKVSLCCLWVLGSESRTNAPPPWFMWSLSLGNVRLWSSQGENGQSPVSRAYQGLSKNTGSNERF